MKREPLDAFEILSGARAPSASDREGRVQMLGEAGEALLSGRMPSEAARLFLAGGLMAWLQNGGNLTRDFWRTAGRQGSTHTESILWQRALLEERRAGKNLKELAPSSSKGNKK